MESSSIEFKRLLKLAELEKRIEGTVEKMKDSTGDLDVSDIVENEKKGLSSISSPPVSIPAMIIAALKAKRERISSDTLHSCMDEGIDSTVGHIVKHRIAMSPEDATYLAIGRKDSGIRDSLRGMTISKLLSMITNQSAVSQYEPEKPMSIDDFDQPRHIKVMITMKGISPSELGKTARSKRDALKEDTIFDNIEFTLSNGQKVKKSKEQALHDKDKLQQLINDGVIIKVIKLLSSGQRKTVYEKLAEDMDLNDILHLLTYIGE